MGEKSGKWTLGEQIIAVSGMVLIGISILTFAFLFSSSVDDLARITQLGAQISGIPGFILTNSLVYATLIISLLVAALAIFTVFYHRENISSSFQLDRTKKFFGFLMIYVLVQLVLTEIFAYLVPNFTNQFPFQEALGVQNFVFAFVTLEETVIYQLIPMVIVLSLLGIMRGKLSIKTYAFYNGDWIETLVISSVVALVSTFIISGTSLEYVSDFASLTILNIIFLRYGFLKAFLTNFSITMTNVTASLIAGNAALSQILPLFLFFLGFLGVYSLVQVSVGSQKESKRREPDSESIRQRFAPQIEPFINSRCPECGNAVYHVILPDLSLKCEKCEHVLPKDATGEKNIKIELTRSNRS